MKKTILLLLVSAILICSFSACNGDTDNNDKATETEEITEAPFVPAKAHQIDKSEVESLNGVTLTEEETNYVIIEIKNYGKMLVRLFPNVAPTAVKAFKQNVKDGFFNGKNFDLIIKHSFIQCNNNYEGEQEINGEFKANGFENNLSHVRGVLSLPRADESTSDASSFFICTKSAPALNSQHAAFGFVVYGADLIDDIAAVKINADQSPTSTITITSISFAKLP
jgi:peptidyl-prolyl cis-trans isomerase B (cyclophilin B)